MAGEPWIRRDREVNSSTLHLSIFQQGDTMEQDLRRDLTRTVLAILIIGGLIVASFWILRPFLAAIIWATMIVVSTWPMLRALQRGCGASAGSRSR